MLRLINADIKIEDQKLELYSSVTISQQFNAHHEFTIRVKFDMLEKTGTLSLGNAQKFIGKSAIIEFRQENKKEIAYEFRGMICEVIREQSDQFTGDLVLKGYSPTILLENGPNLLSFYKLKLDDIVEKVTTSVKQNGCRVNIATQYKTPISYICQYRESTFHFLNRLSSEFGEWFYYDGRELLFGKPTSAPELDISYGIDVHNINFSLRILPMTFSSYSYASKDDKVHSADAPSSVSGLDQYASFALQESNKIFTEPVNFPLRQRVQSKTDLEKFVEKQKAAMAANLEVLRGSSENPALCIGAVVNVSVYAKGNNELKKEDYGKFVITAVEHHAIKNGRYYNTFEAIPSGLEIMPVKNITMPVAEPQLATVKENKDPDNLGRVRAQMLWQKDNEMTDWIRVMTPDAGGGRDGARNRGLVCVPEKGDQVLICFRYNDPDRPFVLGSMFHGKSAGGGGEGNKSKSLTALSGSTMTMVGDAISIIDAKDNSIIFSGAGKIDIKSSASITLTCGSSEITMNSDGKIEIKGTEVTITGSTKATMQSTALFKAEGTQADIDAVTTAIKGDSSVNIQSDAKVDIGSPATSVEGKANLKLQSTGTVDVEGTAMTNVKGGVVNLN